MNSYPKPDKRHSILHLIIIILFTISTGHAARYWVDERTFNNKAYFLFNDTPFVAVYDIQQGVWVDSIGLPHNNPSCFHFDDDYLYVGYNGSVYRYNHQGGDESPLLLRDSTPYEPRALYTDGDFLFVFLGSVKEVLNRRDGTLISRFDDWTKDNHMIYAISHFKEDRVFYGRTSGISPSDIDIMTYDSTGTFLEVRDSPHHGIYGDATKTWVFPDGKRVVDNSGTIYEANSLKYLNSFGTPGRIFGIAFFDSTIIVSTGDSLLIRYDPDLILEQGRKKIDFQPNRLIVKDENVLAFYRDPDAQYYIGVSVVSLDGFAHAEPIPALEATSCSEISEKHVYFTDSIVYFWAYVEGQILPWNVSRQEWDTSIPLLGSAELMTYSSAIDAFYLMYPGGKITILRRDGGTFVERPFFNNPRRCSGFEGAGRYLVLSLGTGNNTHMVIDQNHRCVYESDEWREPLGVSTWCDSTRRIYYYDDNSTVTFEQIGAEGTIDTIVSAKQREGRWLIPLNVKPDGSIVIVNNGNIYDGATLEYQNYLLREIECATWIGDDLFSIDRNGSLVQWSSGDYQIRNSAQGPNSGCFLIGTVEDSLLVVVNRSTNRVGSFPSLTVFNRDLRRVLPGGIVSAVRNNQVIIKQSGELRYFNLNGRVVSVMSGFLPNQAGLRVSNGFYIRNIKSSAVLSEPISKQSRTPVLHFRR